MKHWSHYALIALLAGCFPALAHAGSHCGATAYPASCCFQEQCGPPEVKYRVCYCPVVEEKTEVCYRPVYRTVLRECRTTVCQPVYEHHTREVHFTSYRPCREAYNVTQKYCVYHP